MSALKAQILKCAAVPCNNGQFFVFVDVRNVFVDVRNILSVSRHQGARIGPATPTPSPV